MADVVDEPSGLRLCFCCDAIRSGKPLLVLKHLKRALQLNPDDAAVHRVLCKVAQTKLAAPAGVTRSPAVEAVITEGLAGVTGGKSPQELNDQYLKCHAAGPFLDALVGTVECPRRLWTCLGPSPSTAPCPGGILCSF